MSIISISAYGFSFLLIAFLIFIVLSAKINKTNAFFALTLFFLLGWAFTLFYYYSAATEANVLIIGRLNFVMAVLFAPSLYLFIKNYPIPKKDFSFFEKFAVIETLLLAIATQFSPIIVATEHVVGKDRITEYGQFYNIFILHFIGYLVISLIRVFQKWRSAEGIQKIQASILFWSITISLAFGLTTNIVVPLLYNDYKIISLETYTLIQNLGVISSITFGIPISISILKFQFLDVRLLIGKVLNKIILSIFVLSVFYTVTYVEIFIFTTVFRIEVLIVGIIIAMLFVSYYETLSQYTQAFIEKVVINPFYNATKSAEEFNTRIGSILEANLIAKNTIEILQQTVNPEGMFIYFAPTAKKLSPLITTAGTFAHLQSATIPKGIFNHQKFSHKVFSIDRFQEDDDQRSINEFEKFVSNLNENSKNIKIIIFITKGSERFGFIALGERNAKLVYSTVDIQFLENVADSLGWALARTHLYSELDSFNEQLQEKINQATIELRKKIEELNDGKTIIQEKNLQLKNAYHELKTLDNAKSEFISIASHQLRTPISIIKGYLSMILEGDFGGMPEPQLIALHKASDNIQQLNDIVEDILNASRIERGKMAISPEKTEIVELVKSVVSQLQPKADKKQLTLTYKGGIKEFITLADRNKIYEVIINLVDNAINYTQKGSVTVITDHTPEGDLLIAVKDTGIGIPEKFKAKMFQRFSRSDNAKSIRPDGTGIGLYVAKSFIEAHQGQIWFESTVNVGTTFFVKLLKNPIFPAAPSDEETTPQVSQEDSNTVNVPQTLKKKKR